MAMVIKHGRVLIAENDARTLASLTALVASAGHQPIGARTGADALEVLRAGGIDLVLLGRALPDMPGGELRRQLRHELHDLTVSVLPYAGLDRQDLVAHLDDLLLVRGHHRLAEHERAHADREAARWRLLADVAITVARCRTYEEAVDALARVFRCELDTEDLAFFELRDGAWTLRASCGAAPWPAMMGLAEEQSLDTRVIQARIGEREVIVLPIRAAGRLRGCLCVTSMGFDRRAERLLREVNDHLSNVIANVESWLHDTGVDTRALPTTRLRRIAPRN